MKLIVLMAVIVVATLFCITGILYAANGDLIVNGNLGVGTTSPQGKAEVNGNLKVDGTITNNGETVTGNATVSGNATVNGNLGIGTATPQSRLDVVDLQLVKIGQAGIFTAKDAYITATCLYNTSIKGTAEAKNVNGVLYVRGYISYVSSGATLSDSGWIAGNAITIKAINPYVLNFKVTTKGIEMSGIPTTCVGTVDW